MLLFCSKINLSYAKIHLRQEIDQLVSQMEFAYNDIGLVTDVNETFFGGTTRETDYTYDQKGNLSSITYPYSSVVINITPDHLGRIDTLKLGATEMVTYEYIGSRVAQRKYTYPATDIVYQPSYDNLGRITSADSGTSYAKFDYTYEDNTFDINDMTYDHRTSDPVVSFDYDNLHRLMDVDYGINDTNEAFTIDKLGNHDFVDLRSGTEDYVIDANVNRYITVGGNSLSYDAAGNLTTDKNGYDYVYDYENRIIEVNDISGTRVAEFAYDALGRRIRKIDSVTSANSRRYYYNDNWQVLTEKQISTGSTKYYFYGNYIDEVAFTLDNTSADADQFYLHDHLYNTVAVVNFNLATIEERYEYDAYGKVTVLDTDLTLDADGVSDYNNTILFTGRRLDVLDDGDIETMYYRNRYYNPDTGRFLTHDPLQYIDGLNMYEYVKSRPIKYTDAFGLSMQCDLVRRLVEQIRASGEDDIDAIRKLYRTLALGRYKGTYKQAGKNMLHWLSGSDEDLEVSSGWLLSDQEVVAARDKLIESIKEMVQCNESGETDVESRGVHPVVGTDVWYGTGRFTLNGWGEYKKSWRCGKCERKLKVYFYMEDPYDWHNGLNVSVCGEIIPDSWALKLQEYDNLQIFNIVSYWKEKVGCVPCNNSKKSCSGGSCSGGGR